MGVVSTRGITLSYGTPGTGNAIPTVWTAVAQLTGANIPGMEAPAVEVYDLADEFKRKRASRLLDAEEVAFTLNFDPTLPGHIALRDLLTTPASNNKYWKVTFPGDDNTTPAQVTWQGPLTGFAPGEPGDEEDENLTAEVTIAVGSLPVWTAGTP